LRSDLALQRDQPLLLRIWRGPEVVRQPEVLGLELVILSLTPAARASPWKNSSVSLARPVRATFSRKHEVDRSLRLVGVAGRPVKETP
jgi:hypothetical protein